MRLQICRSACAGRARAQQMPRALQIRAYVDSRSSCESRATFITAAAKARIGMGRTSCRSSSIRPTASSRRSSSAASSSTCRPISVVVVEPGCIVKAFQKEDGASMMRFEMAFGKAYAALALSRSSKLVRIRNEEKPVFMRYLMTASGDKIFAEGGGLQIRDKDGEVIGAVGVTGDTEDQRRGTGRARHPCGRAEDRRGLQGHGPQVQMRVTWASGEAAGRRAARSPADPATLRRRWMPVKPGMTARRLSRVSCDFQDQLPQHRLREIVVGIGRHDERARPADDVVEIIFVQVVFERHDRQAVDDRRPPRTASSRASRTSRPRLLEPSPEMSITRLRPR